MDQAGARGAGTARESWTWVRTVPLICTWVCPKPTSHCPRPCFPRGWGSGSPGEDPEGRHHPPSRSHCSLRCPQREGKSGFPIHLPPHRGVWGRHVSGVWNLLQETWTPVLETMPGPLTSPPFTGTSLVAWYTGCHSARIIPSAWDGGGGGMSTREALSRPDAVDPGSSPWPLCLPRASPGAHYQRAGQVAPPGSPAPPVMGEGSCAPPVPTPLVSGCREVAGFGVP